MSCRHLTMDERNVVWRMKLLRKNSDEIGRCLGRSPSTIGRALRRNAEFDERHFPGRVQAFAKACKPDKICRPWTGDRRRRSRRA